MALAEEHVPTVGVEDVKLPGRLAEAEVDRVESKVQINTF